MGSKMRIIKIGLIGTMAFIIVQSLYATKAFSESALLNSEFAEDEIATNVSVENNAWAAEAAQEIWKQYCIAKNAPLTAADVRSEAYANAIQGVNKSIAANGENPEILLLASRVYRGKGGVSYARNYFSKACAIYLEDVLRYPDSIEANLNAAIILYAGDVRYWDSYNDSKKKAEAYADKVLDIFKNEKISYFKNRRNKNIQNKNREKFLEEASALAFLIKENYAAAEKHFARAEKLHATINEANADSVNQNFENDDHGFVKIMLRKEAKTEGVDKSYLNLKVVQ